VADDFALAAELVTDAGRLARQMRSADLSVRRKTSVSDIVTLADSAAEEQIVQRLRQERPEDGVVGEEGASYPGRRTWLLDPIDGTYNYAAGVPFWCSALALLDGGTPVLGAVYIPDSDELWIGGPDHPTTCNGTAVPAVADTALIELSVCSYLHPQAIGDEQVRRTFLALVEPAATVRMLGSGSVELAYIAGGRLGAFAQNDCQDWDWHPGRALVEAAGGVTRVLVRGGHRWHLAGNRVAVDDLVAAVGAG
jgi:myo-inositol-1(or 4)-monophosphatase